MTQKYDIKQEKVYKAEVKYIKQNNTTFGPVLHHHLTSTQLMSVHSREIVNI